MKNLSVAVVATVAIASGASAGLVIDDYSVQIGASGLDINAGAAGASLMATNNGISVAGTTGDRKATLTLTNVLAQLPFGDIDLRTFTLANPVVVDGNYNLNPGNFLNSNSGLGTNGFSIELQYDIPATNLSIHGDRFEFEFGSGDFDIDQRNPAVFIPLEITVVSGSGTDSSSVLVSDEGFYSIDFSSYSGVDFSDVTQIRVNFGGQVLTPDFLIGVIQVVPAPGAVALLGVAGLGASRRRR